MVLVMVLSMCSTVFWCEQDLFSYAVETNAVDKEGSSDAQPEKSGDETSDKEKQDNSGSDEETSAPHERAVDAEVIEAPLYEKDKNGKEQASAALTYSRNWWFSLTGREADLSEDSGKARKAPASITIEGVLPDDVTAKAEYISFDEDSSYDETALLAIDVTLYDGDGNVYVSEKPVNILIYGKTVSDVLKTDKPLLVYSYAENAKREKELAKEFDKELYAADVLVYRDGSGSDDLLAYETYDADKEYKDGEDAVRYAEDKGGLAVTDDDALVFEYDPDRNDSAESSAHFMLSAQKTKEEAEKDSGRKSEDKTDMSDKSDKKEDGEKADSPENAKKNSIAKTIEASDSRRYNVSVTYDEAAGLPEDAGLEVKELRGLRYLQYKRRAAEAVGAEKLDYARVFDISIVDGSGREYQPDAGVEVKIQLLDENNIPGDLQVVHFTDSKDDADSVLDSETKGRTVSFETDGFSIFAVVDDSGKLVDEDGNPVYIGKYTFFTYNSYGEYTEYAVKTDLGNTLTEQRVKYGDLPVIPENVTDPTDPDAVFAGWYEGTIEEGEIILADKPYDFNNIPELTPDEKALGYAEVHLYAVFKDNTYVIFHEQRDRDTESFPVAATRKVELDHEKTPASGEIDISEVSVKYFDKDSTAMPGMEFYAWSYTPVSTPGSPVDDEGQPISPIDDETPIEVSATTHLYPLFKSIKWLSFYSGPSGSGATYYAPFSFSEGEEPASLSDRKPTMAKKAFAGWYTGSLGTSGDVVYRTQITDGNGNLISGASDPDAGVSVTGGKLILDRNATLYAKWNDDPSYDPPQPQVWYLVKIDTDGGALYTYDDGEQVLSGTGSTWFWIGEGSGETVAEYTNVTRDYVLSASGRYYFVNRNREYYGYPDEYVSGESNQRQTYYTTKIGEATGYQTYKYAPGTYRYAGWYKVNETTGEETPYTFGTPVTENLLLRLHWKKAGEYFIQYEPVVEAEGTTIEGRMDDGSESASDENGYADNASIELNRSAIAPDGYEFIGWRIRDDESGKVYRPGETFTLLADHAVTLKGKKTVIMEAAYTKASTAKTVFDANGGTIKTDLAPDFSYIENTEGYPKDPVFSVGTDKKSVTVTNLIDNGVYKLSSDEFFTNGDYIFAGWNTKKDGSGKHYDKGKKYAIDSEEPVTLYAEWKVKVYFDKNNSAASWDESSWGTENPDGWKGNDGRQYYTDNGRYYILVPLNSYVTDPDPVIQPSLSGSSFRFWSASEQGGSAFAFDKTRITEEKTLYARWTASSLVPLHVFTAEGTETESRDGWRKESKAELEAGTSKTIENIVSEYVSVPEEFSGYEFSYAYIGTAVSGDEPGDDGKVKSLSADNSGAITVTFKDDTTSSLGSNSLYLVYKPKSQTAEVKINYMKETGGGNLAPVKGSVDGSTESDTITYDRAPIALNAEYVDSGQLNNATVSQSQIITASSKEIILDQDSTKSFNMPARLDDGVNDLGLIYSRIGTGNSGAVKTSSISTEPGTKLHLQIRDGVLKWSYDGKEWNRFEGSEPTIYAIFRESGHDLQITKKVTADTGMSDYQTFTVTVSSPAITEESYSVEGYGHNTVEATPATETDPGSIRLSVKNGSDVNIIGLAGGEYTVKETGNDNYTLSAMTGRQGGTLEPASVTGNTTVQPFNLEEDKTVALSNAPYPICRIDTTGEHSYQEFFTLNEALDYTTDYMAGTSTIEMLVDYVIPSRDRLEIPANYNVTITSASGNYVIKREKGFTKDPMFDNLGTLTLSNITLDGDGGNIRAGSELVRSSGELTVGDGTTFKNANNTGNGGAVYIDGGTATVEGGSFEHNAAAKGGAIYVASGDLTISGGTFGGEDAKSNSAENGGAVYYAGSGTLEISGGEISYNRATTGSGGALYAEGGLIKVSGGNIHHNGAAQGNGGAIYADSAIINVSGSTTTTKITNNTARSGGAVYFAASGTFTMSGGQISDNTAANGDGGAIRISAGTVDLTNGSIINNTANGNGGAVHGGAAIVTVSGGTYAGNQAHNGSAFYIDTGTGNFSGGTIQNNTISPSHEGGAVGIGSDSAKLNLSGTVRIKENKFNGSVTSNVYLDKDTDAVISIGNITSGEIGIYVPGDYGADLFKNRGRAAAIFGGFTGDTFTDKHKVINSVTNDRLTDLKAVVIGSSKKVMWGKSIRVVVKYKNNFTAGPDGFPPQLNPSSSFTINDYYLPEGENNVSSIAEDLRTNYSDIVKLPTNTSVFAGAFDQDANTFGQYLTDVNWSSGDASTSAGWKYVRRYKDEGAFVTGDLTTLTIWFAEPAYISIENNTDYELDISSMNVFGRSAINGDAGVTDYGYGFVYAKNGAIRDKLMPITADDLKLTKMKSIKLVFPGACGQNYDMTGSYIGAGGKDIPVRINGTAKGSIPQDKLSSFTLGSSDTFDFTGPVLPSSYGGTVNIVFGGDKPICKVVTQEVTLVTQDKVVVQTAPDASGNVEYCFARLGDAKDFITNHNAQIGKVQTIQMLVDYLIPSSDTLAIPSSYDITLNTAVQKEGDRQDGYYYEGERATISRDSDNYQSFITSTANAKTVLRISNLKFDGKSLGGNIDGGVVKTSATAVYIDSAEFVNCIANNGGGIYIAKGSRSDVNVSITNTDFDNCRSKSTASRQGGGAIWTDVQQNTAVSLQDIRQNMTDEDFQRLQNLSELSEADVARLAQGLFVYNCNFSACTAYDQGGALFHRIDGNNNSVTTVYKCEFNGSEAHAAGGMESGAKYVYLVDNDYIDCTATERNGGGANFYSLNSANPTATCSVIVHGCTFDNCRAKNNASGDRYGGGLRSTATHTYVTDCEFRNCYGYRGGGVAFSSSNAQVAEIRGCRIQNCESYQYGGGVFFSGKTLLITNEIDKNDPTKTKAMKIENCTAGTYGGGIRHDKDAAGTILEIHNAEITGNTSSGTGTNGNGGGISVKGIRSVEIHDSKISNNVARSDGGGINMSSSANDRRLTIDHTEISGNRSGTKGGGINCDSQLTLMNGSMIKGNVISTAAGNAAGVYLADNRTLTVGEAGSTGTDNSSIIDNATDGKVASNMRLWYISNSSKNHAQSVFVNCDLSGRIGVVNANAKGDQFGSSAIKDPKGFGFADNTQVFRADDGSLVGVVDRSDPNGKKLIWRGDVICKITDSAGHLLYLDENGEDPAVFDALDIPSTKDNDARNNKSKAAAFSYLRNTSPVLYYKDGSPYTQNAYNVKMLDSYRAKNRIFTYTGSARSITLTTAGRTDSDYPYRGRAGTTATVTRAATMRDGAMISPGCTLVIQSIILDGGSNSGVTTTANSRLIGIDRNEGSYGDEARVTIGPKATLQNSAVTGDGGAVLMSYGSFLYFEGGEIRNCSAANGGGIYKDGKSTISISAGNITLCTASNNGGGVYVKYSDKANAQNTMFMSGGSISKCSANNGGGIFLENKTSLDMSGGSITNNSVTNSGGGIAVGGNAARLYFAGRVNVSGNTLNSGSETEKCNVELGFASTAIINTSGLDRRAYIGVYVPDRNSLYNNYGVATKRFGTCTEPVNLQRFVNDRNGLRGGLMGERDAVYWIGGTRNVILRKISGAGGEKYRPLSGARLTFYHDPDGTTVATRANGDPLENIVSNGSGAFYVGEMYYGTYYVKETVAPDGYTRPGATYYYILTVDADGVGYLSGGMYNKELNARDTSN